MPSHDNITQIKQITECMRELNILQNYACWDANNFTDNINKENKSKVIKNIENFKKNINRDISVRGARTTAPIDRKTIAATAKFIKELKAGECHTFAQLVTDTLLNKIMKGDMDPKMNIKMVSHKAGEGSHTFILIGHQSNNLKDLSSCIIVDPWLVAMGHDERSGVYIKDQYPYQAFLANLECVYDSTKDKQYLQELARVKLPEEQISDKKIATKPSAPAAMTIKPSSSPRQTQSSLQIPFSRDAHSVSLFGHSIVLKTKVLEFINECKKELTFSIFNRDKRRLIEELYKQLNLGTLTPENALKTAVSVFFTPEENVKFNKNTESYSWTSKKIMNSNELPQSGRKAKELLNNEKYKDLRTIVQNGKSTLIIREDEINQVILNFSAREFKLESKVNSLLIR